MIQLVLDQSSSHTVDPTNIPSQLKALGNSSQLGDAAEALKVEPPSSRRQKI